MPDRRSPLLDCRILSLRLYGAATSADAVEFADGAGGLVGRLAHAVGIVQDAQGLVLLRVTAERTRFGNVRDWNVDDGDGARRGRLVQETTIPAGRFRWDLWAGDEVVGACQPGASAYAIHDAHDRPVAHIARTIELASRPRTLRQRFFPRRQLHLLLTIDEPMVPALHLLTLAVLAGPATILPTESAALT